MRMRGVEPPRAQCPQAPEACASANSATSATNEKYSRGFVSRQELFINSFCRKTNLEITLFILQKDRVILYRKNLYLRFFFAFLPKKFISIISLISITYESSKLFF